MSRRGSTIFILGVFGVDNLGNEASLGVALAFLRRVAPQLALCCICPDPERTQSTYGVTAIPIRSGHSRRHAVKRNPFLRIVEKCLHLPAKLFSECEGVLQLRRARALIIPGTGILDDFGESPRGLPLSLLKWCFFAKVFGAKIFFVSVGAGPIRHPRSRRLMRRAAWLADYRSYRDGFSQSFMRNLGVGNGGDPVFPDLVFALEGTGGVVPIRAGDSPLEVGVGLMAYYGWRLEGAANDAVFETYLGKMTDFIVSLLRQDAKVRLLIGELSDRRAVTEVLARVSRRLPNLAPSQIVAEPIHTLQDVLCEVAKTDLVVCTRFHNLVCALLCDKPVISLGYSEKNEALMEDMGLGRYCQHVEHFSPEKLRVHFDEVYARRYELSEGIRVRRLRYRDQLDEQFARLRGLVRCGPSN